MKLKGRQHITRERDPDDECYKALLLSLLRPRVQYSHSYTNIYSGSGTKATYRKVWWIFSFFFCLCVNEWRLFRRLYLFLTRNYYWTARWRSTLGTHKPPVPFTWTVNAILFHKNVDLKRQTRRETTEKIPFIVCSRWKRVYETRSSRFWLKRLINHMSPNHIASATASKTNFACISRNLIRLRDSLPKKNFLRSFEGRKRRLMRPICDLSGKKQSVERVKPKWRIEISGDPKVIILKFSDIDARRRENKSHRTETCIEISKRILPHSDGLFSPRKAGCHEISVQEGECKTRTRI